MPENTTLPPRMESVTGQDIDQGKVVTLRKTYPEQLALWQTYLPGDDDTDDYSNTVELYDAVPKYFASKKRMAAMRENGKYLGSLKRHFKHRGRDYQAIIRPARTEAKDGSEKEYYPSWREELVEEALKKIACDESNGVYLNDAAGVEFTLYELRQELKIRGHAMHFDDLLTSLRICRGAGMIITGKKEDFEVNAPIFPVLMIANRREWERNPERTRCYVQFHPLITHSINQLAYRQLDYVKFMKCKRQLARWFHKRLSHNYLQASLIDPYRIKMSTVVRDSALVNAQETRHKMRYINESLDELKDKEVLLHYAKEPIMGKRRKIEDIFYTLTPHPHFVGRVRKANKRDLHLTDVARRVGLLGEAAYTVHARAFPAGKNT